MILILLILGILVTGEGLRNPIHSWDTVPYVALTLSLDGVPDTELHAETYRRLREELPSDVFQAFVAGGEHRKLVASDPDHMDRLLPFWVIKPLYLWTTYVVYKSGVDVVHATTVVSSVSAGILAFLIGIWMMAYFRPMPTLAIAVAIAMVGGLQDLTGLARPDGLSALLVFASLYVLLERKVTWISLSLAAIAVVVRPDYILIAFLLSLYIAVMTPGTDKRHDRLMGLLFLIISAGVYFIIQHAYEGYGWEKTFYISFVTPPTAELIQNEVDLTAILYVKTLYWSVLENLGHWSFVVWVAINFGGMLFAGMTLGSHPLRSHILLLLVMTNIAHWLAFPSFGMRFFTSAYLSMLCIMATMAPRVLERRYRSGDRVEGSV